MYVYERRISITRYIYIKFRSIKIEVVVSYQKKNSPLWKLNACLIVVWSRNMCL